MLTPDQGNLGALGSYRLPLPTETNVVGANVANELTPARRRPD